MRVKSESIYEHVEFLNEEKDIEGSRAVPELPSSEKHHYLTFFYFCFIDYIKAFDCVDHNKLWKILKERNTRPPYLSPEKPVCRSRSNS